MPRYMRALTGRSGEPGLGRRGTEGATVAIGPVYELRLRAPAGGHR